MHAQEREIDELQAELRSLGGYREIRARRPATSSADEGDEDGVSGQGFLLISEENHVLV